MTDEHRPNPRTPRPKRAEGQWALGYREPLNKAERAKRDQDPLEAAVLERILSVYAKKGFRSIDPADLRNRFRWYGMYTQRPEEDGFFMMRIRIPGGVLTHRQVETIGALARDFGRNVADVTDRQNVQLHWIRIEDVPEIWARLSAVGLSTRQTCGDTTRNVLGCPLAGVDAAELVDATPWVHSVGARLTGTLEFSNLPRKYKMSIAGCRWWCHMPEINDVGVVGTLRDGRAGFEVMVGGGLSTRPMFAQRLGVFVPPEDLEEVCVGITAVFRDYGYRRSREKARLKFLVADWGAERFRRVLEREYLGRRLADADDDLPHAAFRQHLGPGIQKDGLCYVGGAPAAGRVTGEQLIGVAGIARRHGAGRLRTTLQQKIVVLDVPEARVEGVCAEMEALGLPPRPSAFRANTIACTGIEFCKLAITETKHRARWLVEQLERRLPGAAEEVRLNVNGCPNSCARFQLGDIGLMGVLATGRDDRVEAFQVHLGGRIGNGDSAFARKVPKLRVPGDALPDFVAGLIYAYRGRRNEGETFSHYVGRLDDGALFDFAMSAADERVFLDALDGLIESGVPRFEPQAPPED